MALPTFNALRPIVNVDTRNTSKCVLLPVVSTIGSLSILVRDATGFTNGTSSIFISTQGLDRIDFNSNRISLTRPNESIRFLSFSTSTWSIFQNSPIEFNASNTIWSSNRNGDGSILFYPSGTIMNLSTIGANDNQGDGWSIAYIYTTCNVGSFNYNYSWKTIDSIDDDWPFEYISQSPPIPFNGSYASITKIATTTDESGSRTLSWSYPSGGVFITLGVYSVSSQLGRGFCSFQNLPLRYP